MIKYLQASEIDRYQWDKCIEKAYNTLPYACSWYLDLVCENWGALVKDDYRAVFPLPQKRKFGIDFIYQPYFMQQGGLFVREQADVNLINDFISKIPANFKQINVCLNTENEIVDSDFEIYNRITHHLDLSPSYEELVKGFSINTRRNIKKAKKENLSLSSDINGKLFLELFLNHIGNKIKDLGPKDYQRMSHIIDTCLERGFGEIYGLQNMNKELISSVFFLKGYNKYINIFAASNAEGLEKRAMYELMDHFVQLKSGEKATLDFEGSMIPGVARLYKSFGGKEVPFYCISRQKMPLPLKLIYWLKNTFR